MNLWQNFVRPANLTDALEALRDSPAPAMAIAGGTDLLLDLEQGRHSPVRTLVDLTSVAEMNALEVREQGLFVGAAAPLACIASSELVIHHAAALAEACALVGGPQVRNVATLGGNVAHALPAADGTIALVALGAQAEVAASTGTRFVRVEELFEGPGKSKLIAGRELIVGFYVAKVSFGEASAFRRIMRPQGVALPILNVAVWLRRSGIRIVEARVAVGPSGPTPRRSLAAERILAGASFDSDLCKKATEALRTETSFRSSARRASAEYRRLLVGGLLRDAVVGAWNRTWQ